MSDAIFRFILSVLLDNFRNTFYAMKYITCFIILLITTSCNRIPEVILAAQTEYIDTLDVNDYRYVIDKKNRRGYVTTENKIMDGRFVVKRDNKIIEEFDLKDGYLHGQYIEFNDIERPETISHYKNSVQHGTVISFYENGAVRSETSFQNGQQSVEETTYALDGTISSKKLIKEGVLYKHHYKNGELAASLFQKTIEAKTYELIVTYNSFGVIEFILGREFEATEPVIYIFNANFELMESFNIQENRHKIQPYFSALQYL